MSEGRYFYKHGRGYLLEVSKGFGIGLALCQFEENASLQIRPIYGNIFIKLPKMFHREVRMGEMMASYGFSWTFDKYNMGRDIHFNWGYRYKIIHMPWDYTHIRHDVLMANNEWRRVAKGHFNDKGDEGRPWNWTDKFQETHDYTYHLRNGEVQNRKATIGVEEREWRQKWLKWCPWFAKVSRTIDVRFDQEVGERTGSWKGGCTGCGYDLRKGESPLACLRRMEAERKFK
jgi:hypothetical protein